MDPAMVAIAKSFAVGLAKRGAETAIAKFADPLTQAFPALRHLRSIRITQLERAVSILQDTFRTIECTQDDERIVGFANMCYRYLEIGAREHREMKLRILAAACVRFADSQRPSMFDDQEEVFRTLEDLQEYHVEILKHIDDNYTTRDANGKCNHDLPTNFVGIAEAGFAEPGNAASTGRLELALATLVQRNALALGNVGPQISREDGAARSIVDPLQLVRVADIRLTAFGCGIIDSVRSAFDAGDSQDQ